MPGVEPSGLATNVSRFWQQIMTALIADPRVNAEPALKPYTKG
jgi:hypothetical protein